MKIKMIGRYLFILGLSMGVAPTLVKAEDSDAGSMINALRESSAPAPAPTPTPMATTPKPVSSPDVPKASKKPKSPKREKKKKNVAAKTNLAPVARPAEPTAVSTPVSTPEPKLASPSSNEAATGPEAQKNASKDGYTIFNPTPRDQMREFNPDRPGETNTPFTIDAGHYQLEVELANYSRITIDGTTSTQLNLPNPYLRIGLTNNTDIEVGWVPQTIAWTSSQDSPSQRVSGIGDVTVAYKQNILGNEGAPIAWAIMPGVKIPTNTNGLGNDKVEPTLMVPFGLSLPSDWSVTFMPEIDVRKNDDSDAMHTEFSSPVTVGHPLFGGFEGYGELITHSSNEDNSPMELAMGVGVTLKVGGNMQFDLENNFGLNRVTPPFNVSAGWTVRY